jgi:hypothetical protein
MHYTQGMMKWIGLIPLLLINLTYAQVEFWKDPKSFHNKRVEISGRVIYIKKVIKARDNYYIVRIQDDSRSGYVQIKWQTITNLKRINDFECKKGNKLTLSGQFLYRPKKSRIGNITILHHSKDLSCANN